MPSELLSSLSNNQFFSAGFGLVGVTAGLAILRKASLTLYSSFRRYAFATCEITSRDLSYNWLLNWLSKNFYRHQVSVSTNIRNDKNLVDGQSICQLNLVPAPGKFIFFYNNKWIICERTRNEQQIGTNSPFECITMTTLGRNIDVFKKLLEETRINAIKELQGTTVTLVAMGHEWRVFGNPRPSRQLDSVILDKGIKEFILNDINSFISSSDWYHKRGIPYRRGYLLYGPPGTGKTSFIFALAGHLNWSICVLNLADKTLTDDRLAYLLHNAPNDAIVVLEDLDAPFNEVTTNNNSVIYEGLTRVTFTGLLNALDGIISSEGRIIFATTNHINKLNHALLRPGRFDIKILIDNATDHQIHQSFVHFYPNNAHLADEFVKNVRLNSNQISMAQIQAHFLNYKNDPHSAAMSKFEIQ